MDRRSKLVNRLAIFKINLTPKQRIFKSIATLVIIILSPIIIFLLPENYFDKGESVCISKLIFNQECYACGMARACKHLLHLNFEQAFIYNMASIIVLPILSLIWVKWFFDERKKLKYLISSKRSLS